MKPWPKPLQKLKKLANRDKELIDPQKGKLVLSKLGLLSKINDLSRFFNRRDFENVDRSINGSFPKDNDLCEIVLFEDAEFESSFFLFL